MKEKTRLKKLKITSVDMCGAGMNQDAHINLYKSNDKEGDNETMDEEIVKKGFFEALKEFFGGNHGEVKKAQPMPVAKAMNVTTEAEEAAFDFYKCIDSIICDPTLNDDKRTEMLKQNIAEFSDHIEKAIPYWAIGENYMEQDVSKAKRRNPFMDYEDDEEPDDDGDDVDREEGMEAEEPEDDMDKGCKGKTKKGCKTKKAMEGDDEEMRIDKSKLTPEEIAQYDAIVNKAAVRENDDTDPQIRKALDDIAELKKGIVMKQFEEQAQKYAVMGKDPAELAKSLYDMNERDPEICKQYISILDEGLKMVNDSGMFAEIGKGVRGNASTAVGKAEGIAKSLMQADPTLSYHAAMAKAWEQNPEFVREYDKEY